MNILKMHLQYLCDPKENPVHNPNFLCTAVGSVLAFAIQN